MYFLQMVPALFGGWYVRAMAALTILTIPGLTFLLLITYLIFTYKYKDVGVEIACKDDLEKIVTSLNWPLKTKSYVSKRSELTMTYKVYGEGEKILFLAAGLGCKEYLWYPILKDLSDDGKDQGWTFVTWYYRGMFRTNSKENTSMSVVNMAEDAKELLEVIRAERGEDVIINAFLGWSAGVQIVLEFAKLYPNCVDKLILNCGTHGHIAHTFLQPLFRLHPVSIFFKHAATITQGIIKKYADWIIALGENVFIPMGGVSLIGMCTIPMWTFRGRPIGRWLFQSYIEEYLCNGAEHLRNYLDFTVELDKHSVYHKLNTITNNTLILTGFLDFLTPAYVSYEIREALPNSEIKCWALGTHFIHIEYSDQVCKEIQDFLGCKEKADIALTFVKPLQRLEE